jgi:transcription initiation factor IIE alpha subunit
MKTIKSLLDTAQRIYSVFGCKGPNMHVTSGFALRATDNKCVCPACGADVTEITDTPLGQAYFAFARPDLTQQSSKAAR